MNNKEKYKKAFSVLHTSDTNLSWEVKSMAKMKRKHTIAVASAAVIGCALIGGTSAYAANLGGIQRTVQLWIHGDQTDATLTINNDGSLTVHNGDNDSNESSFSYSYTDENGESQEVQGGGLAMDADGTTHPLTEDDIIEEMNAPDVEYLDDGTVMVYYKNQKIDITDKFDKDKVCYLKIVDDDKTLYLTIKYQNGFAWGDDKYADPSEFN